MPVKHRQSLTKRFTPYAESSPFYYDLKIEPGVLLKKLIVYLQGQITFAGGTTSGTSQGENPGNMIAKIDVDADPTPGGAYKGGKIVSLSPRAILRQRIFDKGSFLPDLLLGATGIVGAATSYTFALALPVYFSNPLLENPDDTALRLDQFDAVRLSITTATVASGMLQGNDRTITLSGVYMDVVEDREFAPKFWPLATQYQDVRPISITGGANKEFAIDSQLPKDDAFLSVLLIAETTNQALSDSIVNKATVFSGTDEIRVLYNNEIKGEQQEFVKDQATTMTGLYFLNLAKGDDQRGRLANAMRSLSVILDVANPGTDRILVMSRRVQPRLYDPTAKAA